MLYLIEALTGTIWYLAKSASSTGFDFDHELAILDDCRFTTENVPQLIADRGSVYAVVSDEAIWSDLGGVAYVRPGQMMPVRED